MPKKAKKKTPSYSLPSEPSEPLTDIGQYMVLIYGGKKVGKTSMASRFPDAMFLMFEPGGKDKRIFQEPMTSWAKFRKFVQLLEEDERFRTVVIDIVDIAYDLCMEYVGKKNGFSHPGEMNDFGKSWGDVRKEFMRQINRLASIPGKGLILLSHEKEREVKTRTGRTYHRVGMSAANQCREVLEGAVDVWARFSKDGTRRVLTLIGDDYISAGYRMGEDFECFRYTDGSQIHELDMGVDSHEAYATFMAAFQNELDAPPEPKPKAKKKKRKKKRKKA